MKKLIISLFFVAFTVLISAQSVRVSATLDNNNILIGQQSNFNLSVESSEEIDIKWPEIGDTIIREIEVVEKKIPDTVKSEGKYVYNREFVLTSFDSGYYAIPAYEFYIKDKSGEEQLYESNALLLEVHTIAIDTTAGIKPIVDVMNMPVTFAEIAPKIGIGLLILAVLAVIIYVIIYFKKHKKMPTIIRNKPIIPANRLALDSLYLLEKRKLWQNGGVKEYYGEITDILRRYIAGMFGVQAVEMITDDIFEQLSKYKIDKISNEDYDLGRNIFVLSDFVKFAKHQTEPDENMKVLEDAYTFVKNTWKYIKDKTAEQSAENNSKRLTENKDAK